MICSKCGARLNPMDKICVECRVKIQNNDQNFVETKINNPNNSSDNKLYPTKRLQMGKLSSYESKILQKSRFLKLTLKILFIFIIFNIIILVLDILFINNFVRVYFLNPVSILLIPFDLIFFLLIVVLMNLSREFNTSGKYKINILGILFLLSLVIKYTSPLFPVLYYSYKYELFYNFDILHMRISFQILFYSLIVIILKNEVYSVILNKKISTLNGLQLTFGIIGLLIYLQNFNFPHTIFLMFYLFSQITNYYIYGYWLRALYEFEENLYFEQMNNEVNLLSNKNIISS
jgi:hypothetical protein